MASEANRRLCSAAEDGDVAGITAALLAGADPNAHDETGFWTPLLLTVYHGHVAAIAALLAAGARVDGAGSFGNTPLICAADGGHTVVIDALLAAGADVHHADRVGDTALHYASQHGHVPATRVLLDAGARMDVRTVYGDQSIDVVRVPQACSLPLRDHDTPRLHAQACRFGDKSNERALRALFASAAPWCRRRPVAIACYAVEWEWEA
jgi:hypothetical protein